MTRRAISKNSPVPPCGTPPNCALPLSFSWLPPLEISFRVFSVVRGKKFGCREPEKIPTLPEDQQLMPENEPEKNLKIQLLVRTSSVSGRLRSPRSLRLKPLRFFGHFHISTQNPPPFQRFQSNPSKKPRHFNCSALFRFVPPKIFPSPGRLPWHSGHVLDTIRHAVTR